MTARWTAPLGLLLLTAVRLAVAGLVPLSADEAYYWVWSHALSPGYLDHPPMVALWIWVGTAVLGDTALGVRLLAPLSAAAGSLLLADAASALFPGRRLGVPAAVLLNATLMFGAGAVTMTPDTPLLFFWTAALWALARLLASDRGAWWLAVGAASGLALDSKYTAALLGVGIVLWLTGVPGLRRWFRSPWLWAGGVLAGVLFAPVVLWNAGHGWASFAKQGGRAGDWRPAEALRHVGELVAGQAGLATPLLFVLLVAGAGAAVRRVRDPAWALLAALCVPGALVFLQHAVGDRVQANWVAILYPAAALAAAALSWRWWRAAAALGAGLTALVYVQAVAAPFPLPRRLDPTLIRLAGWDGLAGEAERLRAGAGAGFIAAESYGVASLLAWHAPPGTAVLGAEPRWALFGLPRPAAPGTGLLLVPERRSEPPNPAFWEGAERVGRLVRRRGAAEAEGFAVYRVTPRPGAPGVLLPGRAGG